MNETARYRLPSSLFAGYTPMLRKLSLDAIEVPWMSSIFKNLTFLRINCIDITNDMDGFSCRVEVQRLLEIIGDCPNLVSLVLKDAGPTSPAHDSMVNVLCADRGPETSKVDARSLTVIQLHGLTDLKTLLLFLDSLRTPHPSTPYHHAFQSMHKQHPRHCPADTLIRRAPGIL